MAITKKIPNGTKVMACPCVGADVIVVKSSNAKRETKPRAIVPWFNRTKGAEFQDKKFGKGMRLHNLGGKGTARTATCTVCGVTKAQ